MFEKLKNGYFSFLNFLGIACIDDLNTKEKEIKEIYAWHTRNVDISMRISDKVRDLEIEVQKNSKLGKKLEEALLRDAGIDPEVGLGRFLRAKRDELGLSVIAVASDLGISRSTIYSLEGENHVPSQSLTMQLAKRYGVDPDVLLIHREKAIRKDIE